MGHHHHKRGVNCSHGLWATDDQNGGNGTHHHHKRGNDCVHGVWATDSQLGHHHHKLGNDCEHFRWATSDEYVDGAALTSQEFSDDPSVEYDLGDTDMRTYEEIEAELADS